MADLVEGEWKNFTIRLIGVEDFPPVSEHFRNNFYVDEPVYKTVGNPEGKLFKDLDTFVQGILGMDDKLSLAAFDKDTGKIAAVCMSFRNKKESSFFSQFKFESDQRKIILNFVASIHKNGNAFQKYGIEEFADLYAASVDKDYRRRGLAFELCQRTITLVKASGLVAIESYFSSPYTRQIATKLGFEELTRRNIREMQDLNGKYICPGAGDEEFVSVMALKL